MTAEVVMKSHGDSLARIYAQDVALGKRPFGDVVMTITAEMLKYRKGLVGAMADPNDEVRVGADRISEWAGARLKMGVEAFNTGGAQALRRPLGPFAALAEKAAMPDGTPSPEPTPAAQARFAGPAAPPASATAPPDPRRLLTEAMALESAAKLGMPAERAVEAARKSVAAMSDEEVRHTLDSLPERGWAMRPDGTLAPPGPPADPMAALLRRMQDEAAPLAATHPSIAATVAALAERIEHLRHDRLRTRVAWAAEDVEKALGRPLDMPPPLRAEIADRIRTAPGLANDGMRALLAETRSLRDPGLVAAIREEATKLAQRPGAEQRTAEAAERVDRLAERVRLLRTPAPPVPASAPVVAPTVEAASPGSGPQAPPPTVAPPSSPPPQPRQQQQAAGVAEVLARGQAARAAGSGPPWDAAPAGAGLGERLAGLEERIARLRAAALVSAAARDGDAALRTLQRVAAAADPSVDLRRQALAAVQRYGDARVRAEDAAVSSKMDGAKLAPLAKLDEQVARQAAVLSGLEDGKSLLEGVVGRAAEALREAAARAAAAVVGAVAALKPKPQVAPGAAPSLAH